jgi:hypothetical protein
VEESDLQLAALQSQVTGLRGAGLTTNLIHP